MRSSLIDGLLIEAYRDPRDIYVAARSDGQLGSGVVDDPFNGSTTADTPVSGTLSFEPKEFVIVAPGGVQGLSPGDMFNIFNVTGPGAEQFPRDHNFTLLEILETQLIGGMVCPVVFTAQTVGVPLGPPDVQFTWKTGVGIQLSYYDTILFKTVTRGVSVAWPVAKVAPDRNLALVNYDAVRIENISDPTFAGTYPILGAHGAGNSFRFRLTSSALPAGVSALSCRVTRLIHRFDRVLRAAPNYAVIHVGPGTFETRGFTPLYVASSNFTEVFVGFVLRFGQRLLGSGIGATRLKLVLPMDELGQTTAIANPSTWSADYAEVADMTIDCNAPNHQAPFGIFPAPVTCGAVNLGGSFIKVHRVRAINFCVQARAECFPIGLSSETNPIQGSYLPTGSFNVIENCIVEQPGENNCHETSLLSNVGDHYANARSPVVRNNYLSCEYSRGSSEYGAVAPASYTRTDDHFFKLNTKRPHNRIVGNNIRLTGVLEGNASGASYAFFIDTFKITDVNSATGEMTCESPSVIPTAPTPYFEKAYIGVEFHGPHALGCTGGVTHGNSVHDCTVGLYTDTGSTRDAVVRDNYYSEIGLGMNLDFNAAAGGVSAPRTAASLTRSVAGGRFIATVSIPADSPPGYSPSLDVSVGDAVTVSRVRVGGNLENPYNGTFSVCSVSSDKREFSYQMKSDPGANADIPASTDPNDSTSFLFQARWQIHRLSYEGNLCDVYPYDDKSALAPHGISTNGYAQARSPGSGVAEGPPFMFLQAVIRDNFFRFIDSPPGDGSQTWAIRLASCGDALIENNLASLEDPQMFQRVLSQNVLTFGNTTPTGEPLPIFEDIGSNVLKRRDTLEETINDALLFALL